MTNYCKREREDKGEIAKRFGVFDQKGRELGAKLNLLSETFTAFEEPVCGVYYNVEPGRYFSFVPKATRSGVPFGASQAVRRFRTLEERNEAIDKYFRDAEKRARKGFGK